VTTALRGRRPSREHGEKALAVRGHLKGRDDASRRQCASSTRTRDSSTRSPAHQPRAVATNSIAPEGPGLRSGTTSRASRLRNPESMTGLREQRPPSVRRTLRRLVIVDTGASVGSCSPEDAEYVGATFEEGVEGVLPLDASGRAMPGECVRVTVEIPEGGRRTHAATQSVLPGRRTRTVGAAPRRVLPRPGERAASRRAGGLLVRRRWAGATRGARCAVVDPDGTAERLPALGTAQVVKRGRSKAARTRNERQGVRLPLVHVLQSS